MKIIQSLSPQKLVSDGGFTKHAWAYRKKKIITIHIMTMAGNIVSTRIPLSKLKKWIKL